MPERVHQQLDAEAEQEDDVEIKQMKSLNGKASKPATSNKRKTHISFPDSSDRTDGPTSRESRNKKQSSPAQKLSTSSSKRGKKRPLTSTHHASPSSLSSPHHNYTSTLPTTPKGSDSFLKNRAQALWPLRKELPVWAHSLAIRRSLRSKDVLLLSGATGSGKSTQVPQILLTESWCQPGGCIAVTEPRRVAAVSLARRVAEEMGSPVGTGGQVGYSVRFDNCVGKGVRIKFLTEGMLLREILRDPWLGEYAGVVVDEVHERGVGVDLVLGFLKRIVEERGEGRGGRRMKVCVMSATADMKRLRSFFEGSDEMAPETNQVVNGVDGLSGEDDSSSKLKEMATLEDRQNASCKKLDAPEAEPQDVRMHEQSEVHDGSDLSGISATGEKEGDEELSEWSGISRLEEKEDDENSVWSGFSISDDEDAQTATPKEKAQSTTVPNKSKESREDLDAQSQDEKFINGEESNNSHPAIKSTHIDSQVDVHHIEGRQFPVKINFVSEPVQDILEASLKTIFQIHLKEPLPGDILVFLTGQETVESLTNLVQEYSVGMGPEAPKIVVLPLFAALPQIAQHAVFEPTPPRTRKIIISTNIAETSITVPGVCFVIDCGKAKVKHFRTNIGLESLLVKPISKSAAIQRKGRAGREAPGECYRLYTEEDFRAFEESNTPEILRCDLSHPILTIRARGVEEVLKFPFLDQPPREAMEKALLNLWMLGALTDSGAISNIGAQIARFPLSVSLGRALLAAAEPDANCVLELIDIIACLSVENVFVQLNSEEKREEAESARRDLYKREGDHLTFLATVRAYAAEGSDRKAWAERHFVSHRAMRAVMDVRKQLRALCLDMKILTRAALAAADAAAAAADDEERSSSILVGSEEVRNAILKSFLKGFAMNTAALCPDGSYRTLVGKQTVAIHPSSVLFGRKVEAIVFTEFVYTKRSWARGVSAVQLDWVRERFPS